MFIVIRTIRDLSVGVITDGEVLDVLELDYSTIGIGEDHVTVGAVVSQSEVTKITDAGVIDIEGIGARATVDDVGESPGFTVDIKSVVRGDFAKEIAPNWDNFRQLF